MRRILLVALVCLGAPERLSTQVASPADGPWAGWIRCQVTAQGEGYSDQQTHTWAMSGGTPRVEGVFRIFPATWSVVGSGSLQRTTGTNTVSAQWATNGQASSAPIAVFTRGDGRLVFALRHEQLRAQGGFTGYRFYTVEGKRQTPESLAAETYEYRFPAIDAATSNAVNGSSAVAIPPSNAFLPQPGSTGNASCTWQFGVGASAPAPPPTLQAQATPMPPAPGTTPPAVGSDPSKVPSPTVVAVAPPGGATAGPSQPTNAVTPSGGTVAGPREAVTTGARRGLDEISDPPAATRPTSGYYLVTINGLQAGRMTADDPLGLDGRGDEIYAAAFVRCYDRSTYKFKSYSRIQSSVYGDSNGGIRIRAGTQSAQGGIRDLDTIPLDLQVARVAPASDSQFPLKVWEGPLTDGKDAVFISPSIWESDFANHNALGTWFDNQNLVSERLFSHAGVLAHISTAHFAPLTVDDVPALGTAQLITHGPGDRPIGVSVPGVGSLVLPNTVVALTREIVEKALSGAYMSTVPTATPGIIFIIPKPGILILRFADGDFLPASGFIDRPAVYYMVLQVERTGPPPDDEPREKGSPIPPPPVAAGCNQPSDQQKLELEQLSQRSREDAEKRRLERQLQEESERLRRQEQNKF